MKEAFPESDYTGISFYRSSLCAPFLCTSSCYVYELKLKWYDRHIRIYRPKNDLHAPHTHTHIPILDGNQEQQRIFIHNEVFKVSAYFFFSILVEA